MKITAVLFVLIALMVPVFSVECPSGFNWDRMSGPGCVQSDCAAKGGQYTYTRDCYCGETRRACYEAVNYTGFDPKKCEAFCPNVRLIGCADANGKCPNEQEIKKNPTQQDCDKYCLGVNGPNGAGKLTDGKCECKCKEGYSTSANKISLCQPVKATCDKFCKEYKEKNKIHGEFTHGTVIGASCDCHCDKGYYADDSTLTCKKAANCEEVCNKTIGEGALHWAGTFPNCACYCKDEYKAYNVFVYEWKIVCKKVQCPKNATYYQDRDVCICDEGFNPIPIDGECITPDKLHICGDAKCEISNPDPNQYADYVPESCANCPEDCECEFGQVCNPNHPSNYGSGSFLPIKNGCIESVAKIIDIGCADRLGHSPFVPQVDVERSSIFSQREGGGVSAAAITARPGMMLNIGDRVTLRKVTSENQLCNRPYITLQFGDVKARMMLGQVPLHTLTIKENAMESGWPELITAEHAYEGVWSVFEIATTAVESFAVHAVHAVNFLLFTSAGPSGETETVKVYVESRLIVNQTPEKITFYTIEGSPIIEFRGKNTTLYPGMKLIVDKNGASTPVNFTGGEIDDWFLTIPDPPGDSGGTGIEDILGSAGNLIPQFEIPDMGNATKNIEEGIIGVLRGLNASFNGNGSSSGNTSGTPCCCSTVGLVLLMLVLAAWSGKKEKVDG